MTEQRVPSPLSRRYRSIVNSHQTWNPGKRIHPFSEYPHPYPARVNKWLLTHRQQHRSHRFWQMHPNVLFTFTQNGRIYRQYDTSIPKFIDKTNDALRLFAIPVDVQLGWVSHLFHRLIPALVPDRIKADFSNALPLFPLYCRMRWMRSATH